MHGVIKGSRLARTAIACALAFSTLDPVLASPSRLALVIGNSNYTGLPALPACIPSAEGVAKALRDAGFQVLERKDLTRGGLASAINELAKGMESAPDASVVIYLCGYAAGMNDRPFLLPVSAAIQRPSDAMTQGILAKTLLDLLVRGRPSRGVLALDLAVPGEASPPAFSSIADVAAPDGVGFIAVVGPAPVSGPTALATALASGVADPKVETAVLLSRAEAGLRSDPSTRVAALRIPPVSRPLAAIEAPPPPPPQTAAPEPARVQAPPAQSATPPARQLVLSDEAGMTDIERKRVQEALARVGYYGAKIDGVFGSETRAAIRRFQHEIGAEQTGFITGEQAIRLLTLR
jgi:hypothetical protein